jgi:integrase
MVSAWRPTSGIMQPVAVIQAILRHKSPQTTARYLQTLGLRQTHEAMESIMGNRGPGRVINMDQYRNVSQS